MATRKPGSSSQKSAAPSKAGTSASGSAARTGAGSAKQSMSGPAAKKGATGRRGVVERVASALGGGGSDASDEVRNRVATERLDAKVAGTEALVASIPENVNKP